MYGCIYLWSWSQTKAQRPDKKSRAVCAVVLAELQWTNTEIPYLALNTCPGKNKSKITGTLGECNVIVLHFLLIWTVLQFSQSALLVASVLF